MRKCSISIDSNEAGCGLQLTCEKKQKCTILPDEHRRNSLIGVIKMALGWQCVHAVVCIYRSKVRTSQRSKPNIISSWQKVWRGKGATPWDLPRKYYQDHGANDLHRRRVVGFVSRLDESSRRKDFFLASLVIVLGKRPILSLYLHLFLWPPLPKTLSPWA